MDSGSYKVTVLVVPNGLVELQRITAVPLLPVADDRALRDTVRSWRFWPTTFGDCAVRQTFEYTIHLY
jgi:hypothetical protein